MKRPLRHKRLVAAACVAVCLAASGRAVSAQQVMSRTLLPDSTIERVVDLYNREETTRLPGDSRLAAGTVVAGDAMSLNGELTVAGNVEGDVVAINGDVHLLPTAVVVGSVTAIGGTVHIDAGAKVGGTVTAYRESLRLREDDGIIAYVPDEPGSGISAGYDFPFGRTDILLTSDAYNRTEGLPISVGPRGEFGSSNPTRVRALVTYRTANGITVDPDELGYFLGIEQFVAGSGRFSVLATAFREIRPIEDAGLRNREASLAAFVLHRDQRDHYARRGWSAGARFAHPGLPYDLTLEYRDERNLSVAPAAPVSIIESDKDWRSQPLIAEGRLRSLTASFNYDSRNDVLDPADGWLVRTMLEQGLDGTLATSPASGLSTGALDHFSTARFDVRRYARLSPYSRLSLRALLSGSLDGGPLPAQRQQALGGAGTLPGYGLFELDCGARDSTVVRGVTDFYPFYGCDRAALVQLEYQASFPFARKISEKLKLGNFLTHSVRWAAFFDAGRAWTEQEARGGRQAGGSSFSTDAGFGLRLGAVGFYYAIPLSDPGDKHRISIRLGPRL
ncbi:MAG TPA: BamA/TamA family outer membrane protein [Longimicrobiales bacterium]